jgi:hypothetical protein
MGRFTASPEILTDEREQQQQRAAVDSILVRPAGATRCRTPTAAGFGSGAAPLAVALLTPRRG